MSLQTSVRPARRTRPSHHVSPNPRARRARRVHQALRAAEHLGLISRKRPPATQRSRPRRQARASGSQVQARAQVQHIVRVLCTPGPVYFLSAMLAGMAAAFLAGLWLY